MSRFVTNLWCDDIRLEVGDKPSFMGVYTGGMSVPHLPLGLPRLCVWICIDTPLDRPVSEFSARIERNDGEVIFESGTLNPKVEDIHKEGRTRAQIMLQVTIIPLELPADCRYLDVVVVADGEELRGRRLWVEQAAPATSTPAT